MPEIAYEIVPSVIIEEANEGEETGWMIIGVTHDGTLQTEATTRINEEDNVLVAGTDTMIQEFGQKTEGS